MNSSDPVVVVDGLRVQVRGRPVLDGIDLTVAPGERVAVVGPSGSGKSLTAAAVVGLLAARLGAAATVTGRVVVAGTDVSGLPAGWRPAAARPGYVGQDSSTALNPLVRVGVQLRRALAPQHGRLAAAQVHGALEQAAFDDPAAIAPRYPGELSGGQRQRVAIAMGLAAQAPVLVADEPTASLDVLTQAEVVGLLRDRTGPGAAALVLVTHELAVAADLCDRIVVLAAGRVVEHGPCRQLLDAPAHPVTARLVAAVRRTTLAAGRAPAVPA